MSWVTSRPQVTDVEPAVQFDACISLAVPGRTSVPGRGGPERQRRPRPDATGPRSVLGPWRTGIRWARAVTNGHQRRRETGGRAAPSSGSSHNTNDQIRLCIEGRGRRRRAADGQQPAVRNDRGACPKTVEDHDRRSCRRRPLTWRFYASSPVLNSTQFREECPVQISHGGSRPCPSPRRLRRAEDDPVPPPSHVQQWCWGRQARCGLAGRG